METSWRCGAWMRRQNKPLVRLSMVPTSEQDKRECLERVLDWLVRLAVRENHGQSTAIR